MQDNSPYPASGASGEAELVQAARPGPAIVRQADTDQQLIDLWLHGRSVHTQRAYRADVREFLRLTAVPLHSVTLGVLQGFADRLQMRKLRPATRQRRLAAVKSLIAFGHRIGYLPFDVAGPLRLPAGDNRLSERILDEADVKRIIAAEANPRNRLLLTVLYFAGVRVSEVRGLLWRDCRRRRGGNGQVSVRGKGDKTRAILLPKAIWEQVDAFRKGAADDMPVFRSRRGGPLHQSRILRVVRQAARRVGITLDVSPHWFRHAHASHALDRGAPIHLVQGTLGHASIATTGRYLHARPSEGSSTYLTSALGCAASCRGSPSPAGSPPTRSPS